MPSFGRKAVPNTQTAYTALIAQMDAGGAGRQVVLDALKGTVLNLTMDKQGCRVVQKALDVADLQTSLGLVRELQGSIRKAATCPNGNYVIQKIVEKLPAAHVGFVAAELKSTAAETSSHRCGCRVMCRLIEHALAEPHTVALVKEILKATPELSRHAFGHFVIQSILEHGTEEHRSAVANSLKGTLFADAQLRSARYVVESALEFCSVMDRASMIKELLDGPDNFLKLADNQNGCNVARLLLKIPGEHSEKVEQEMHAASRRLHASQYGRRLLDERKQSK